MTSAITQTRSTSSSARSTVRRMNAPSFPAGACSPGVSTNTICVPGRLRIPVMRLRVVCGRGDTIASFSPTRRLSSVDLPEFGRPTREAKPARMRSMGSSGMQQALPQSCRECCVRRREDLSLAAVHQAGFDGITVIVADEVEDAVGDEELKLEIERNAESA